MFSKKRKKDKKISVYAIISSDNPRQILNIVRTRENALEFARALIKKHHKEHFESWCGLKNLDVKDEKAFDLYFDTVVDDKEKRKYKTTKIFYTIYDLLAIVRMFGGYESLGCSYESELEMLYKETIDELVENIESKDNE